MMANAAGEVAKPSITIPPAIYGAIAFVILLYVGISLVVLGNVSEADLAKYADTAVAQAARPVMGDVGFVAVSIAALLATASAINAMLFSSTNMAYGLGKEGQLPSAFTKFIHGKFSQGMLISVVGVLVLVNLLDLTSIANIASAALLITYLAVFIAHWPACQGNEEQSWHHCGRIHPDGDRVRYVRNIGIPQPTTVACAYHLLSRRSRSHRNRAYAFVAFKSTSIGILQVTANVMFRSNIAMPTEHQ